MLGSRTFCNTRTKICLNRQALLQLPWIDLAALAQLTQLGLSGLSRQADKPYQIVSRMASMNEGLG